MDIIFLVLKKQVDKRNMCNFAKALNTFNLNIPIAVLRFFKFYVQAALYGQSQKT